jgi:hypothetical protein
VWKKDPAERERQQQERAAAQREREQRKEERRAAFREKRAARETREAATVWLPALGVAVYEGNVYRLGLDEGGWQSDSHASNQRKLGVDLKSLGPLTGARADVAGGKGGHRRSGNARVADAALATALLGPVGLLAGASRAGFKGVSVVAFPDGTTRAKKFKDAAALAKAEVEAGRFNALAAAAETPAGPTSVEGVSAELERLAGLHTAGLLDNEEFRAAKARILGTPPVLCRAPSLSCLPLAIKCQCQTESAAASAATAAPSGVRDRPA